MPWLRLPAGTRAPTSRRGGRIAFARGQTRARAVPLRGRLRGSLSKPSPRGATHRHIMKLRAPLVLAVLVACGSPGGETVDGGSGGGGTAGGAAAGGAGGAAG